jgi:glutamine cyclotransferase
MKQTTANIIDEYGPFSGVDAVHGVSYDGEKIWFASGNKLHTIDPASGEQAFSIDVIANAGTAYDGQYLYQIADDTIQKIDPNSGDVLSCIPTPESGSSGLAWAEGSLWVGQYQNRKIHQIDPQTGALISTIESNRFVTGVTWLDGNLWHGTWEGDESELRRVNSQTGEVLESLKMPQNIGVSGLESNGKDRFYCGGGNCGKVRVVLYAE